MTRVLLVDDDEMSWDMLSRRLIRRGFEVIFAVDGKQGVEVTLMPDIHRRLDLIKKCERESKRNYLPNDFKRKITLRPKKRGDKKWPTHLPNSTRPRSARPRRR